MLRLIPESSASDSLPVSGSLLSGRTRGATRPGRLTHVRGLDGLRAIAVLAVIAYHNLDVQGLPALLRPSGGFLGVEAFLVISGYLITSLLLNEHERTGTIELAEFWRRRARRLLPALYLLLAAVVVAVLLFAPDGIPRLRTDVLGAVFYVTNWVWIVEDVSYFEAAGRPSLLLHLWSLAIEEQFYIVWPPLIALGLRWLSHRTLFLATVAGAMLSTALLWGLFERIDPYGNVSSIYYRTDTRMAAILIGAAMAFVWRPWIHHEHPDRVARSLRTTADAGGVAALVGLIASMYWFSDDLAAWDRYETLYRGGFLATSIPTAVVIAAVVVPGSALGTMLGSTPFRIIGERSYGLYLWHWPVFQLVRPRIDIDFDGWLATFVRIALTVVLAECSYRFVEQPIRRRGLVGAVRLVPLDRVVPVATCAAAVALAVAFSGVLVVPDRPSADIASVGHDGEEPVTGQPSVTEGPPTNGLSPGSDVSPPRNPPSPPAPDQPTALLPIVAGSVISAIPAAAPPPPVLAAQPVHRITFFGDSVMLGAANDLHTLHHDTVVNAETGRQWWEAGNDLREHAANHDLGDIVVVQLGNNGTVTEELFDGVMEAIGPERKVYFVNVRVPRSWESSANAGVAAGVSRWSDRARLLDWRAISNGSGAYFTSDGVHLTPAGRAAYAAMIDEGISIEFGPLR